MSVTAVAAAGTAVALWLYSRRQNDLELEGREVTTHRGAHKAPQTFVEDLYYFAEGLRYTYAETLGRWATADLLIGLAYLSRKDPPEHVTTEIARAGVSMSRALAHADDAARATAARELREIRRVFQYCMGMRERRADRQRAYFVDVLGLPDDAVLMQEARAGVLKPSFVLLRDDALGTVTLVIRGTHSFKDLFTSLTGASKPHHLSDSNGVVLGYSHFGMLAAARWVLSQAAQPMTDALAACPGHAPRVVGHSLGAGTAALLTMMLRERGGAFAGTRCVAVACPACMTVELARACAPYVTSVVNSADVIPSVSPGAADTLRTEVNSRAWGGELRAELRATGVVRALESGVRGVGDAARSAGSWTGGALVAACAPPGRFLARRLSSHGHGGGDVVEGRSNSGTSAGVVVPRPAPGHAHKRRKSDADEVGLGACFARGGVPATDASTDGAASTASTSPLVGRLKSLRSAAARAPAALSSSLPSAATVAGWWAARRRGAAGAAEFAASCLPARRRRHGTELDGLLEDEEHGGPRAGVASASANVTPATVSTTTRSRLSGLDRRSSDMLLSPRRLYMDKEEADEGLDHTVTSDDDENQEFDGGRRRSRPSDRDAGSWSDGGASGAHRHRIERRRRRRDGTMFASDDDVSGEGSDVSDSSDEASDELRRGAAARLSEVEAAVRDARDEAWCNDPGAPATEPAVPAVFAPGDYGGGTPGAGADAAGRPAPDRRNGKQELVWRRALYPAGRILHLVPADLVPVVDEENGFELVLPQSPDHPARRAGGDQMLDPSVEDGADRLPKEGDTHADGARSPSGKTTGASSDAARRPERMALVDCVPHTLYGRIRLCRGVLSDHIIPNYMASLDSALESLPLDPADIVIPELPIAGKAKQDSSPSPVPTPSLIKAEAGPNPVPHPDTDA